jgi:quinol monooxygenase YgiN
MLDRRGLLQAMAASAAPPPAQPVCAVIVLRIVPGRQDDFLALLHPVLDAMRHEASFVAATLHRDPADPARFLLYESWADERDLLEVQVKRPYRDAYWAALPGLLAAPREVSAWRPMRVDAAQPIGGSPAATQAR